MNKKLKIIVIIALYIGLILVGTKVYATTGITVNNTTRLRKEASTNSDTIELISINQTVEIVSQEGDWYKVKHNLDRVTYTGYIRADMLKVDGETKQEENTQTNNEQTEENKNEQNQDKTNSEQNDQNTENTNQQENQTQNSIQEEDIKENTTIQLNNNVEIKILPLIYSSKTGEIPANSKVNVVEVIGKWCHIENENQDGWVMISKIVKEVNTNETSSNSENTNTTSNNTETNTTTNISATNTTTNTNISATNTTTNTNTSTTNTTTTTNTSTANTTTTENKTTTLYVCTTTVNMREKAETSSKILKQLPRNTKVTVVEVVDKTWTKVTVSGVTGYVASQYLSEKQTTEVTSRSSQEIRTSTTQDKSQQTEAETNAQNGTTETNNNESSDSSSNNSNTTTTQSQTTNSSKTSTSNSSSKSTTSTSTKGSEIVAYAKKYLGCKYVSGGTSPSGFDCSGFTQYVYKHFGYSISRTSSAQRSNGKAVKKSELRPGDIVCFTGHVGIYIGGNQFIHAANPKKGVIITSLSDSYYVKNYITARRIL